MNSWSWFTVPGWLSMILDTGEFLALGLYFLLLSSLARQQGIDVERLRSSRTWAYIEFALFILFTLLFFLMRAEGLLYTIFGAFYLLSLLIGIVVTIQMRKTIETLS